MRTKVLLIYLFCFVPSVVLPNAIPLEAAFQGRCENGHPCDQNCFNIHNGMYECDCNEGYVLLANGYNCRHINGTSNPSQDSLSPLSYSVSRSSSRNKIPSSKEEYASKTSSSSNSSIAIQIEVDIDPPQRGKNDLSEAEMKSLGLPSHHVHYTSSSIETLGSSSPIKEELLEPGDIQVTYENDDDKSRKARLNEGEEEEFYRDKMFEIDAYCNMDCGDRGSCFMERVQKEEEVIMKRCLCPLGKHGEKCRRDNDIVSPSFSGHSYLSLPVLTNAYSDLQLTMEFRPKVDHGILLLTGENEEMTGDYLALVIIDRHIELRLDCGTGPGIVRTSAQIHLNRWNKITVYRHDWGVWVQLNDGGAGYFRNYGHYLGVETGFSGCIKRLEINNKVYDFRSKEHGGDSQFGMDITECPEDNCVLIPCQHNGKCVPLESGHNICQCPLGFGGEFCEKAVDVKVPSFNGTSYLVYTGIGDSSPLWTEIELVFQSSAEDGLIFYNGQRNDGTDDFIAILLSRNYVEFAYDLGDGITVVRSASPISLHVWYTVVISRTGRLAEMEVIRGKREDPLKMPVSSRVSNGAFSQLTLEQNLYLGGVPTFDLVSAYLPIRRSFFGCIQKLTINDVEINLVNSAISGVDVGSCDHPCNTPSSSSSNEFPQHPCGVHGNCKPVLDGFKCDCPHGLTGNSCQKITGESNNPLPRFKSNSFLHFKNEEIAKNIMGYFNMVNLRVKTESKNALIFWAGNGRNFKKGIVGDYIALGIYNGRLQLKYNLGSGEASITYNWTRINDGKWHRIRLTRNELTASLRMDNGPIYTTMSPGKLKQLNANGEVYLGGAEYMKSLPIQHFREGFTGCIAELSIGKISSINLMHEAASGRNIENCENPFQEHP
ncbi:unnamed protein product [Lepeophtheirus salmonis]|uniref:(salmon louse) hypothetical protein n=1 Tax=Lepeophtheirus salmonis TaxID=72036 RepID=A0A7R8HA80_LEPSM|nr:unnamed protein product [Lepeophtheirus salmonis]CAF2952548.1 unnamed protein product [Lepeophtheirus salmonis]